MSDRVLDFLVWWSLYIGAVLVVGYLGYMFVNWTLAGTTFDHCYLHYTPEKTCGSHSDECCKPKPSMYTLTAVIDWSEDRSLGFFETREEAVWTARMNGCKLLGDDGSELEFEPPPQEEVQE